jgi:hypothetical protein
MATNGDVQKRLAEVDRSIAVHPLASTPVREAFAVIERHGKEHRDAISLELHERNLPSLDELGRLQLRTSFRWWRLHRSRRSLLKKLGREVE